MSESATQINITLGTAGHIDHGKTALIKLLTGCETDRLKQEKERGMSIELGFAPCRMGDTEVGIVDVPGHEHFVKTMVAGATGIDGVIFVVAADDGIMPQTREHLDILTLLGIEHGLVALTKIDIVPPERIEAVQAELKAFLRGTFLEKAPICPISAITGDGFDGFYTSLKAMTAAIRPKPTEGVFRQPVERAFSVKGFGTVISGIPAAGAARVGDELVLLPDGGKSRIKAIQVYGRDAQLCQSGQCAALNLPQLDYKNVRRGCVLTEPGYFEPARWFVCTLNTLNIQDVTLKNGTKLKFHTGTSEVTATAYLLEGSTAGPCQETFLQIRTDEPLVAAPTDRYILRSLSPVRTIGGGMIIQAAHHKLKRTQPELIETLRRQALSILEPVSSIEETLRCADDRAMKTRDMAVAVKVHPPQVADSLEKLIVDGRILKLSDDLYMHTKTFDNASGQLIQVVEKFHQSQPQSPGLEKEHLFRQTNFPKPVFDGILTRLLDKKKLVIRKDCMALPTHSETFDPAQQALLEKVDAAFRQNLFSPPKFEEAAAQLGRSVRDIQQTVALLIEHKRLVRVEQDLYFSTEAIETARQRIIDHIHGNGQGRLESVDFKYLIDTTRKYAIPLLDYMDKIGVTRRVGNTRYLK